MTTTYTVALLGAGRIAGGYDQDLKPGAGGVYSHAGAYKASGGFCLLSVHDSDPVRARAFAQFWAVEHVDDDLDHLLARKPDVISLCTPNETHFPLLVRILKSRACRLVFAEKPLGLSLAEIEEIEKLSAQSAIPVVVNYQRRFDPILADLSHSLQAAPEKLLRGQAYYMKGLSHIGSTLLDCLVFLLGNPDRVLAYHRSPSEMPNDPSYDFILFFKDRPVVVSAIDTPDQGYCYHLFEIDLLCADQRITLPNQTRRIERRPVGDYVYGGVKMLDDSAVLSHPTHHDDAMVLAANYIKSILSGQRLHDINTPAQAARLQHIVNAVRDSYESSVAVSLGD